MASTYTDLLRIEQQADGENDGTWGAKVNAALNMLEDGIAGRAVVAHTDAATYTLTTANGTDDEARKMILHIGGTLTAARNVAVPTSSKFYIVKNATVGGFAVTVKTAAGTGISVPNGNTALLFCDGTNVVSALDFVGGSLNIAQSQDFNLNGSSTTNYGRMTYNSSGSTVLNIDNGFDGASAEIRLRLRTTGSAVNGAILSPTVATFPGQINAVSVAGAMVASNTDQETATSTSMIVTPGRQHYHPSALKAWLKCGVSGNVLASYNVTGITDTGTGQVAVTWDTDFSSANYACTVTLESGNQYFATTNAMASSQIGVIGWRSDTAGLVDPTSYSIQAAGDQ